MCTLAVVRRNTYELEGRCEIILKKPINEYERESDLNEDFYLQERLGGCGCVCEKIIIKRNKN